MKVFTYFLFLVVASSGCTKGIPTFEELSSTFSAPTPDQLVFEITDLNASVTIAGAYHQKTQGLEHRLEGSSTHADFAGVGSVTLANQRFEIVLDNIGTRLGFVVPIPAEKRVYFRAMVGSLGSSETSVIIRFAYSTTPAVTIYDAAATEGGSLAFTVSLSQITGVPVSFAINLFDLSTSAGERALVGSGTSSIPALSLTQTIYVNALEDSQYENSETFEVLLSALTNATFADDKATGTINDNDLAPSLSIADAAPVTEGGTSSFLVSLSAVSALDAIFSFQTFNGVATSAQDYVAQGPTTVTISAGSTSLTLTVVTTDDIRDEVAIENYSVSLSSLVNVLAGDLIGDGGINDNDAAPFIYIVDASVGEGGTFSFLVSLSVLSDLNAGFNFQTFNGTAVAADYTSSGVVAGQVVAGQLTTSFNVVTLQDAIFEGSETILASLSTLVNAQTGDVLATGTITDDDAAPMIFISDASTVTEGAPAVFAITLSVLNSVDSIFTFQTVSGTATSGSDYTNVGATVATIPAGALTFAVSVATIDDVVAGESPENFRVTLTSLTNVGVGDTNGAGSINDNDTTNLYISDASISEGGTLNFVVSLSTESAVNVTFNFQTVNGTALTADSDYTVRALTAMTITAGSLTNSISVLTTADSKYEVNETLTVTLTGISNANAGDLGGLGTINNDDSQPLIFIGDSSVIEGQTANFAVTISSISGLDSVFTFQTTVGTATAVSDYTTVDATIGTIPAGSISFLVSVVTIDDVEAGEPTENYVVTLTALSNISIGDVQGLGSIVDNDSTNLIISDAAVTEGGTLIFNVSLTMVSASDVTFNFQTVDGSATTANSDYAAGALTAMTISAGAITSAISVVTNSDVTYEANEIMSVTLTSIVGAIGGDYSGTGTINNDDSMPNIFIGDATVTEGVTAVFSVSISAVSALDSIFTYQTAANTATAGSDYTTLNSTIATIPSGSLTMAIAVVILDDSIANEPAETYNVTLTSPTNIGVGDVNGVGTINDNDSVNLFIVDSTINEGGTLVFAVSLSTSSAVDVTFNFQTVNGTATTADSDYSASPLTAMTIAAGALTQSISVVTTQDSKFESIETLALTLSSLVNVAGGDTSGIGAINNDDTQPALFISSESAAEGATLQFSISLSAASGLDTTVSWFTSDNTALLASDYTQVPSTLITISAGSLSIPAQVISLADTLYENNETFDVGLTGATNSTISVGTGIGTITNDDAQPTLAVYDLTVIEGDTASFAVSLSAVSGLPTVFVWNTIYGTATASDLTAVSATTVTIAALATSAQLQVLTTEDLINESTESFTVTVHSPSNSAVADGLAIGTITDDDGAPLIYISDAASVTEGATSTFVVTLTAVSGQEITFNYETFNNTAVSTQDYTAVGLTAATIPAGSLSFTLTVVTTDDTRDEVAIEYYSVSLSSLVNVLAGDLIADGGINDNDAAPFIYIGDASVGEGGTMTFLVSLGGLSDLNANFNFQTYDSTAVAVDYTANSGSGQIVAGQLTTSFNVVTLQDAIFEGAETLLSSLSSVVNASAGDLLATGTITDDETAPMIFIADATAVTEGATAVFAISISGLNSVDSIFTFQTVPGTAVGGSDYTTISATVATIPSGSLTFAVTVDTLDDSIANESAETFDVTLTALTNVGAGDVNGLGTINDNETTPLIYVFAGPTVTEGETAHFTISITAVSSLNVEFNYATSDNTALFSHDYNATSGRGTIIAGQITLAIPVVTSDDLRYEPAQTFELAASLPSNAGLSGTFQAPTTINDNDSAPLIYVGDASASEGETVQFTVSITAVSDINVIFDAKTYDGLTTDKAVAILDYTDVNLESFTITAGALTVAVTTVTLEEVMYEQNEKFLVSLSGVTNANPAGDILAEGTINNDDATPLLNVYNLSISEGDTGNLTVSLSAISGVDAIFWWRTYDGTAGSTDYTQVSLTKATIVAGQTQVLLQLITIEDGTVEANETFKVSLETPSDATLGADLATVTVLNDDATPMLFIDTALNVSEGGTLHFLVSLSATYGLDVTFDYQTFDSTARAPGDYVASGLRSATIPNGSLTTGIWIVTTDDQVFDSNPTEYLEVSLSSFVNANPSANPLNASGGIIDGEVQPDLFISNALTVNEGETLLFTVSLNRPSDNTVSFTYTTLNPGVLNTANSPQDFTHVSTGDTILPGSITTLISLVTIDDNVYEPPENAGISLSALSNAGAGDLLGYGSISSSDPQPVLMASGISIAEGAPAAVVVYLSGISSEEVVFDWSTNPGSALSPADFTPVTSQRVTIAVLGMSVTISTPTVDDTTDEPTENFNYAISPVSGTSGSPAPVINLTSADGPPFIYVQATSANEGANLAFTVSLSEVSGYPVVFNYAVADGTARLAQPDYLIPGAQATIAIGALNTAVNIAAVDDPLYEIAETVTFSIDSFTKAQAAITVATGTIDPDPADPKPNLSILDATDVNEGLQLIFTVSLDSVSGADAQVQWQAISGTATAGSDFLAPGPQIKIIPAGFILGTITVATSPDSLYEADETILVTLTSPLNTMIVDDSGVGTIDNEDPAPTLSVVPVSIIEGVSGNVPVSINTIAGADVVFNWTTVHLTTGAGDLTIGSGTATIVSAQISVNIPFYAPVDGDKEGDETFLISLSAWTPRTPDNAVITIQDIDGPVGIMIDDSASVTEGQTLYFAVSLAETYSNDIGFNYRTLDNTAVHPDDYVQILATAATIPAGQLSISLPVATVNDPFDEPDPEFVDVFINGVPSGVVVVDDTGVGGINDNDNSPIINIYGATTSESSTLIFVVSLSIQSMRDVTFAYRTDNGAPSLLAATAPADYGALNVAVATIPAQTLVQSITIAIVDDLLFEANEGLEVSLSSIINATAGILFATGQINDNDSANRPTIAVFDSNALEGSTVVFTISLSQVSGVYAAFNVETYYGSATATDFTTAPSTALTINAGSMTLAFNVPTLSDLIDEANETFRISITPVQYLSGAPSGATGAINDNNLEPNLFISDPTVTEGGSVVFMINLSQPSGQEVTVNYFTSNGSAITGLDFYVNGGTATIPIGNTFAMVQVASLTDSLYEGNQAFNLNLGGAVNANISDNTGIGTLNDNQSPPLIYIEDAAAFEGGTVVFTVSISGAAEANVNFMYSTSDIAAQAQAETDYTSATSVAGAIPSGALSTSVGILATADATVEGAETFGIALSSFAPAAAGRTGGIGRIDDVFVLSPIVSIYKIDPSPTEGSSALFLVSLSSMDPADVTFNFKTYDGTAIAGTDYTGVDKLATIVSGLLTTVMSVQTTISTGVYEEPEAFVASISAISNGIPGIANATITIVDSNAMPIISIYNAEAVEGSSLTFLVSQNALSQATSEFSYIFLIGSVTAIGGAAADAADYSGAITIGAIAAGSLTTAIIVPTNIDSDYEPLENLLISIASVRNATMPPNLKAAGYIHNDDCPATGWCQQAYLKASIPHSGDDFAKTLAVNGNFAIVGAPMEDTRQTWITNGTGSATGPLGTDSGAAYIFARSNGTWVQEAFLKSPFPDDTDSYGTAVAASGNTMAVGVSGDDSMSIAIINGTGASSSNLSLDSGAVFIYRKTTSWVQEAYIKAPNAAMGDGFGLAVSLDGDSLAVGAPNESSATVIITNDSFAPAGGGAVNSGAVYVFRRDGVKWSQEAFFKAANADAYDNYGSTVEINKDTLVAGAVQEDGPSPRVLNGTGAPTINDGVGGQGAAYVYHRTGTTWTAEAYLKPPNPGANDQFGYSTAVSGDTIVVGAIQEDSAGGGVSNVLGGTGGSADDTAPNSGAAFVFNRTGTTWAQQAFLKAIYPGDTDLFGTAVAIDGDTIVVGAPLEDSNASAVLNSSMASTSNDRPEAGAAYVFKRSGLSWSQTAFLKAENPSMADEFGTSVSIDGDSILVGAPGESSSMAGVVNGPSSMGSVLNNKLPSSGAVYAFYNKGSAAVQIEQAENQFDPTSASSLEFKVVFSKPMNGTSLLESEFTKNVSGLTISSWSLSEINARTFTMTANGVTGNGWVALSLAAGAALDFDGYPNEASSNSYDDTITHFEPGSASAFVYDTSIAEGDVLSFMVSLTSPAPATGVTFQWSTVGVSATPQTDFVTQSMQTTTIIGGNFTTIITVPTRLDSLSEGNETLQVKLVNAAGATVTDPIGIGTIIDDDVLPQIYIDDIVVMEGTKAIFKVGLTSPYTSNVTFSWRTFDITTNTGAGGATHDLTAVGITPYTIYAGQIQGSVTVTTLFNSSGADDPQETFMVSLSAPGPSGASVIDNVGIGVIQDGGGVLPTIYVTDAEAIEGDNLQFIVSIHGIAASAISFNWETFDGTAVAASDYLGGVGSGNIAVGTRLTTILIPAYADGSPNESPQTMTVSLSGATNAIITVTIAAGVIIDNTPCPANGWCQQSYIKAINSESGDQFGSASAISGDTMVIGATGEDSSQSYISNGTTINFNNGSLLSGAAYVYRRTGASWVQEAYLKAPYPDGSDRFGKTVAIDGDVIVVGTTVEGSNQTTISNSTGASSINTAASSGAAYIYRRYGSHWIQEAYVKANNAEGSDLFGSSLSVSGNAVAISAIGEGSNQAVITNGPLSSADNSFASAGAVYIYRRTTTWYQEAYIKPNNPEGTDYFGNALSLDGDTLAVGAYMEDSAQTTVTTNAPADNGLLESGAVYVFRRNAIWVQEAFLKPSNNLAFNEFGTAVAVSGNTIVVGAPKESGAQTSVSNLGDLITGVYTATGSGAAYIFRRNPNWYQEAYLKSSNANNNDAFGTSVGISGDTVVVGATGEDSNQTYVSNGPGASPDNSGFGGGAAYVYRRGANWEQSAYLKPPIIHDNDLFANSIGISGDSIVVGAPVESAKHNSIINGPTAVNNIASVNSGAGYVFYLKGTLSVIIRQAVTQPDPTPGVSVMFTVTFSKSIVPGTFNPSDIIQAGSAPNVTWYLTNTGDDRTFKLEGVTSYPGTLVPSIGVGLVTDVDGVSNSINSPNFDNSVTKY